MAMNRIPEGLVQCPVCGEYNGSARAGDLNWEGSLHQHDPEERIGARCLCHGPLCKRCGQRRIHRPGSNSYDPETNTIGHWFVLMGMFPCSMCRALEKSAKTVQ
jgi:hypothetical protein